MAGGLAALLHRVGTDEAEVVARRTVDEWRRSGRAPTAAMLNAVDTLARATRDRAHC